MPSLLTPIDLDLFDDKAHGGDIDTTVEAANEPDEALSADLKVANIGQEQLHELLAKADTFLRVHAQSLDGF